MKLQEAIALHKVEPDSILCDAFANSQGMLACKITCILYVTGIQWLITFI
jgi:hypothetical protein